MLFATSLALLAATFHGRERGLAFGAWGAVTGIATALAPILGGVLTTGITWRAIFLVNLPIGIVALYLTLRMVDESRSPHARRIDWPGVLTFTAGLLVASTASPRRGSDRGPTAWCWDVSRRPRCSWWPS